MIEFIGHFHPVLVHLPIGILLVAVLFQLLSQKEKYKSLGTAVGISLLVGVISAVLSCISGFMLSQSGDYDEQLVSRHQWLGIATTVISLLAYYLYKKQKGFLKWVMPVLAVLIIVTGHLGGSLTHGSDYLFSGLSDSAAGSNIKAKTVAIVQEAMVYADVIKPVLQTKCYNCHGENKQKGKLRLDEQNFILKGGKDGPVLIAGKEDESELIKRILLSIENENHMPPKEKPQLSAHEIELLRWWVSTGASFDKKVKDIAQNDKIKPTLLALQTGAAKEVIAVPDIPAAPVKKADEAAIQKLKALGAVVIPVAQNSHYLSANFITAVFTDKDLHFLAQIKDQLIWLKLGNTKITDSALTFVSKLTNLTRLYAENTGISDKGIAQLKTLAQLKYLNITGTKITAGGIMQLKDLKSLQQLFLYKTGVTGNDYAGLKKIFPATVIDTGGYKTQMLAADTMLVKPPLGN
jgi:uncharacterized membrane protein/mono/diheme cytochrome c family protein